MNLNYKKLLIHFGVLVCATLILVFLLGSHRSSADNFVSVEGGSWNDGATWGNTSPGVEGVDYPGPNDNAIIRTPVQLSADQSVHNVTIDPNSLLSLNIHTFSVSGDFTNNGSFDAASSTVILTGSNQAILGGNTFNNLTKITTVADTLSFDPSNPTVISGILNLQGTSTGLLTINNAPSNNPPVFDSKFGSSASTDQSEGDFNQPLDVAIDSSDNTYVVDGNNHRIQKFDSSGNFILTFGWGVQDGSSVFQTCITGCQAGISGSGDGQFSSPVNIEIDSLDNIYVTDGANNRIQKFNSSGNFILKWGSAGTGDGEFNFPQGIAINSSNDIYVVDSNNNRIQKFDSSGNFILTFGWGVQDGSSVFQTCITGCQAGISGSGDGQFSIPRGLAVDSSNNIYVADSFNFRVQKFNPSNNFLLTFGWGVEDGSDEFQICTSLCQSGTNGANAGQFFVPQDITINSLGNIYVSDLVNFRIQKFDSSGNFLLTFGWGVQDGGSAFQICTSGCQIGLEGSGNGQFNSPSGLTVDSFNNIYVADMGNNRIEKFDPSESFLLKFGSNRAREGVFFSPQDVALDSSDNSYISDGNNHRIQKFDSSGNFLLTFGWGVQDGESEFQVCTSGCQAGLRGLGNGQFDSPLGITLDSLNNIYVADSNNNRVQKFDSSGNFILKWGSAGSGDGELAGPQGITVDSSNNIYVTDTNNHRVQKFDSNGNFLSKFGTNGTGDGEFDFPADSIIDSSNNIYVIDTNNYRVQKFDSNGNFLSKFGTNGTGDGEFDFPAGISIDLLNNIYVSDFNNSRIQKFDSSGNFLLTFGWGVQDGESEFQVCTSGCQPGINGEGDGEFSSPRGLGIDSSSSILVVDSSNSRIQKFTVSSASFWELSPAGSTVLSYLSVNSSHSTNPITCTNCTDGGNNINWIFVTPIVTPPDSNGGGGRSRVIFNTISNPPVPITICKTGNLFSPITGLACTTFTDIDTLCPVGDIFDSITILPCTSYIIVDTICPIGDLYSGATGFPCTAYQIPPPQCLITRTLRVGSRGDQVKCLQLSLYIVSDGIFGPKTKAAVIIFQRSKGLVQDGIFGPKSHAAWLQI